MYLMPPKHKPDTTSLVQITAETFEGRVDTQEQYYNYLQKGTVEKRREGD